jgi:hypothetical protein
MSGVPAFRPPSGEAIARVRAEAEKQLSPEEFNSLVGTPLTAEEHAQAAELIAWFRRRYPTPAARLAYARLAYARWRRSMPAPPASGA